MKFGLHLITLASFIASSFSIPLASASAAKNEIPKAATKTESAPIEPMVSVPPVNFTDRRLPNGLRVLLSEDHSSPTVAICVGYHVGGKDDPPGRSGFAHLFEHMMFKGTANMKPEEMFHLTEDIGGTGNATTSEDVTNFFEEVPSNYLETLLWAEADRLASLNVDEANFKTERDVVLSEYGQRILSSPYGKLSLLTDRKAFVKHPYGRGIIGTPEDLKAATLEDVQRFHQTYYQPDNTTLALVGDFDSAQANAWIDKYFGRVPKNTVAIPRIHAPEPPQTAERVTKEYASGLPQPAVAVVYHIAPASSSDAQPLEVMTYLLSGGPSSRLMQSLIAKKGLATGLTGMPRFMEQEGTLNFVLMVNQNESPSELIKALDQALETFKTGTITPEEMDTAKTQIMTGLVVEREKSLDRAKNLVQLAIEQGDPKRINARADEYQAVTAAAVQRVAKAYLKPTNRTVVYFLPEAMKPKSRPAPPVSPPKTHKSQVSKANVTIKKRS